MSWAGQRVKIKYIADRPGHDLSHFMTPFDQKVFNT